MSELHPLDFKSMSEVDNLSSSEAKELLDSCNYLIDADFDNYSEEQFLHAVAVRTHIRKKLGGKHKVAVQHKQARKSVVDLLYMQTQNITADDYGKAISGTLETIKTGNSEIIQDYECIQNIPGFELEWCVIQSFPALVEKESGPLTNWESSIGRPVTDAEFNKARRLSIEITEGFKSSAKK